VNSIAMVKARANFSTNSTLGGTHRDAFTAHGYRLRR
jgi:hypothetical protein